ncbi:hypothetical protein [Salipiger pallidus]|nr:hypothetical protein [Salipiger pallidus]
MFNTNDPLALPLLAGALATAFGLAALVINRKRQEPARVTAKAHVPVQRRLPVRNRIVKHR